MEVDTSHPGGVLFARLLLGQARSALSSATRLLSRRCLKLVILLGVPTTVLAFLLRTLGSIKAVRRRRALMDVAERRRLEAHANIAAAAVDATHEGDSTKSAGSRQDVANLSFLELQKRLRDGLSLIHI